MMVSRFRKFLRLIARHGLPNLTRSLLLACRDACQQELFFIAVAPIPHCTYKKNWRIPTMRRLQNGLRRQFGIAEDFRRRATSAGAIEETLSNTAPSACIFLASRLTLADERVRQYLLNRASANELDLCYPGATILPQPNRTTLLTGVSADAEGQACLQALLQRGIACAWLSASEAVALEDVPLKEACMALATPDSGTLKIKEISPFRIQLPDLRPAHLARPLRVLSYRWHVPHQYELFKLGAEFTLISDLGESSCRWWDFGQRPLPPNVRFAHWHEIDPGDFDLAILHFDENIMGASPDAPSIGTDWGKTFRFLQRHLTIPRVAVCHGTPPPIVAPVSELDPRQLLVTLLADTTVVVNSHQAQREWVFHRSRVIWQGFDPKEFSARPPPGGRTPRLLTLPQEAYAERPAYRGADLLEQVAARTPVPLERLRVPEPNILLDGNAYARAKFAHYIAALHDFDIYFNPTLHSPMPRSRGEAMLCGLATVNANSHDVERFICNGVQRLLRHLGR